jgi:hypothetical protein
LGIWWSLITHSPQLLGNSASGSLSARLAIGDSLDGGVEIVIRLAEAALQVTDVLLEVAPDRRAGDEQPVALGDEHLDDLAPAGEERVR